MINTEILKKALTNKGINLYDLSRQETIMLVFLRHFGCIFCRGAMVDLSKRKQLFKAKGITPVFVHMTEDDTAQKYFDEYDLSEYQHISDPTCQLYNEFGLTKGSFKQLFGFQNFVKGFQLQIAGKANVGLKQIGDGFQMPGIFLMQDGELKESFIHQMASDVPNYDEMIKCCSH